MKVVFSSLYFFLWAVTRETTFWRQRLNKFHFVTCLTRTSINRMDHTVNCKTASTQRLKSKCYCEKRLFTHLPFLEKLEGTPKWIKQSWNDTEHATSFAQICSDLWWWKQQDQWQSDKKWFSYSPNWYDRIFSSTEDKYFNAIYILAQQIGNLTPNNS